MSMLGARAAWLLRMGFACSAWLQACALSESTEAAKVHQHVGVSQQALAGDRPSFEAGVRVEQFDSHGGFFRVHYTRSGRHAVPTEGPDVPDYVTRVAADFDRVHAFYTELGYREPVRDGEVPGEHGGDERFDVYLLDFPNAGADGQFLADSGCDSQPCGGYMLLENDFKGKGYASLERAIRLVSSHELFHAVQQAYATTISGLLSEGTAVWASEAFDAEAGDLESQATPYFERPDSSLAQDPMGTDPIRYASAVFFEHIDEHADRKALRRMFEVLADTGDTWPVALDTALKEQSSSIAEQFSSFAEWNLFTADRADPERAYAHGELLPKLKERAVEAGFSDKDVRIFPLAARYYTLEAAAADSVSARAELPDDEDSGDLQLMIAVEHNGAITTVEHADGGSLLQLAVKLERGDIGHVVLYNTAATGNSVRPDLCIATESTKQLCAASDAGTAEPTPKADDGGCAVRSPRGHTPASWLIGLAAATGLVVHRRRARSRRASA